MKLEDFTGLGLSEELGKKCLEVAENEVEKDVKEKLKGFIPKERFDEVNKNKKLLEENLNDRDGQLDTLKKGNLDVETLKSTIETLQEDNKKKGEEYQAELHKIKLDTAVELAISSLKGKNAKAIKALLDLENASFLDDGKIKGLDTQLKDLAKAEDSSFLFEQKEEKKPNLTGFTPAESGNKTTGRLSKEDFRKLSPMERLKFSRTNKEEYNKLYSRETGGDL